MKKIFLFYIFFQSFFLNLTGYLNENKDFPLYKDEILVKYKTNIKYEDIVSIEKKYNLFRVNKKYIVEIPFNCYKVDNSILEEIVEKISKEEIVEYAEPNYIRYALYTPLSKPNDTYYQLGEMWGFNKIQADLVLFNNIHFNTIKNKQVLVAVLDTGVGCPPDLFHEDLQGMTINGINAIDYGTKPYDDGIEIGHGTFVAGIIAANINNNKGIAGVTLCNQTFTAKTVIMPVKVLDKNGEGPDDIIYSGIIWATDNGAKILNLSFGGKRESITLKNAINYAYSKGCILIAASGNTNISPTTVYPALYPNVISVGATNENERVTDFTSLGKIDVCAPGDYIKSTDNKNSCYKYTQASGTSFAAPFVSGLAALLLLYFDNLSPEQVRTIIEQTADDIEDTGFDKKSGWGRINILRALKQDFTKVNEIKTYNWPNPFSPIKDINTNIEIILTQVSDITIEIYDAAGDIVWRKEIKKESLNYGHNTIKWDGRNLKGKKVGNGVYFYVIKNQKIIGKNKIAVLY